MNLYDFKEDGILFGTLGFLIQWVIMPILILGIVGGVVSIPVAVYEGYQEAKSPVFQLKKSEWTCDKTYIYYTYVKGVRYSHEACSNYSKNQ